MVIKIPVDVADVFASYPPAVRRELKALRRLILETAAADDRVGVLEETLKWGEPAYLTAKSKTGSTIRLGWKKSKPHQYAMYFNCQTTLVDGFRAQLGDELSFEGNRAIVFAVDDPVPADAVAMCVAAALTYHVDKKKR